jgi:hypothetical protein
MGSEKPNLPGKLEKTPSNYVTCKRCNGTGWVLK